MSSGPRCNWEKRCVRGILLRAGGAVPRCSQRGAVLCYCRECFHCEVFIFLGSGEGGGGVGISLERWRRRGWGGGTTLPMLPVATLIETGCH